MGQLPPKDPDYINPVGLRPPYRSKPVVIAVHGGTKYLGHELFLASDIRVAADDTVFSQGEVARGVFPGGGATVRFRVRSAGATPCVTCSPATNGVPRRRIAWALSRR